MLSANAQAMFSRCSAMFLSTSSHLPSLGNSLRLERLLPAAWPKQEGVHRSTLSKMKSKRPGPVRFNSTEFSYICSRPIDVQSGDAAGWSELEITAHNRPGQTSS